MEATPGNAKVFVSALCEKSGMIRFAPANVLIANDCEQFCAEPSLIL